MTHTPTLNDLRPSLADIPLNTPVEIEWTTQSGIVHHRQFRTLNELVDTLHGDDGCSCTYDPETDTETATPREISICSFAKWVEDFAQWSIVPVATLDRVQDAADAKAAAIEAWKVAIGEARENGASLREIADAAGCSHQTVVNVLRDYELGILDDNS